MMNDLVKQNFDYSMVPDSARDHIKTKTAETKILVRQTAQGIIEIGKNLIDVKQSIGHGNWLPWLGAEFGWSSATAKNFMQVADKFSKSLNFSDLDFAPSALYLLAQNNTPESVRNEALDLAEAGEKITAKIAKELKEKHQKEIAEKQAEIDSLKNPSPNLDNLIPELQKKFKSGSIVIGAANRLSVLSVDHQKLALTFINSADFATSDMQKAINDKLKTLEALSVAIKERDQIKDQLDEMSESDTAKILLDKEFEIKKLKDEHQRKEFEIREKAEKQASEAQERRFKDQIEALEAEKRELERRKKEATDKASASWGKYKDMQAEIDSLKAQLEVDNPTNVDNARERHIQDAGRGFLISINELRKDMDKIGGGMESSLETANEIIKKASLELAKLQDSQDAIINI